MTGIAFALAVCGGWVSVEAQTSPPGQTASGSYGIAGTVVDANSGRPLAGTEVSIDLIDGKNSHETYATGADGGFAFDGLTQGRYRLSARRRGYAAQNFEGHDDYWSAIVVGPRLKSDGLRFALTAGGSIVGHVMDERGDPIRSGRILLLREVSTGRGRRLTRSGRTELNDLGIYRFGHLEPGAYVVAVMTRPWYAGSYGVNPRETEGPTRPGDIDSEVAYPVTFYPGAMDANTAGRITLTAGETATANMSLAAVPGATVSVRTYNNDDTSVQARSIQAEQFIAEGITESLTAPMSVDHDTITFYGMPATRMEVTWKTGTGKNAQEHLVSVNASERDIESTSAPTVIRGVLEGANGTKVAGATVKLTHSGGGKSFSATVGGKGEFEFREEFVSGLYSIELPQLADATIGIRANGLNLYDDSLEIEPGHEVELRLSAGRAGLVRGRVVKNGAATEGIFVALVPEKLEDANNLMRVGQSDSSGAFELENIVPGRYRLIAVENGWDGDWRSAEFLGRFVGKGKEVEVGAGAVVTVEVEAVK